MQSKQIVIILIFVVTIMSSLGLVIGVAKDKKWRFQPEKYQYIPSPNKPWNLNQMLYYMMDERVLIILLSLYLSIVFILDIFLIGMIIMGTQDVSLYIMSIVFPIGSIGLGFWIYFSIKKANKKKDYVRELLKNSMPYTAYQEDVLVKRLEEDIRNGLLFHTRKVNFSHHYMFISNSAGSFSPIAILLTDIEEIRYDRHIKGGVFIVKCILKDKREVKVVFSNMMPREFIAMVKYFGIRVKW